MILCKVIRDTLQSNTYYLGKYHVLLFYCYPPDFSAVWLFLISVSFDLMTFHT
jgi:hypothetical protein